MKEPISRLALFRSSARTKLRKLRASGDNAMIKRDWVSAISAYEAYLRQQPDDAAILVQFGHALKENGRVEEALAAYDRAASAAPEDEDVIWHRQVLKGAAERVERKADPAVPVEFVTSLRTTLPHDASAQLRADLSRDLGEWRAAATLYCEHLQSNLQDAPIWLQLGHMLKEMSAFDDAIFVYQTAKRLDRKSSDVGVHLAALLTRLGRTSDAQPLWAEMFAHNRSFFLQDM